MFPIVHNHKHTLASAEVRGEARNAWPCIFWVQLYRVSPLLLQISNMVPARKTGLQQGDDLARGRNKNKNTTTSTSTIMPYIIPSLTHEGT